MTMSIHTLYVTHIFDFKTIFKKNINDAYINQLVYLHKIRLTFRNWHIQQGNLNLKALLKV